jgi:hypothetical protein
MREEKKNTKQNKYHANLITFLVYSIDVDKSSKI